MVPITRPAPSGLQREHLVDCSSQSRRDYAAVSVGQEKPEVIGTGPGHSADRVFFSESRAWAQQPSAGSDNPLGSVLNVWQMTEEVHVHAQCFKV